MGVALGRAAAGAESDSRGRTPYIRWLLCLVVGVLCFPIWFLTAKGHRLTLDAAPEGGLKGRFEVLTVTGTEVQELPPGSIARVTARTEMRTGRRTVSREVEVLVVARRDGEEIAFDLPGADAVAARAATLAAQGGASVVAEKPLPMQGLWIGLVMSVLGGVFVLRHRRRAP